jgi:flagellar biosynthesis/type III secretory pathway chaperone
MSADPRGTAGPSIAAPDDGSAQLSANAALKSAAARLLQLLDRETTALRGRQTVDMDDLCDRKNKALLELSRISRRIEGEAVDPELQSMLDALRSKLDENRAVLQLHLQAVGEVADILAAAIRDADSDGTYSTGAHPGWLA